MFKEQCEKLKKIYEELDDFSEELCEFANELDDFNYKIIKDYDTFINYLTNEGLMNPELKEAINLYLKYKNE